MILTTADRIALAGQLDALKRKATDELRSHALHIDESAPSIDQEVHTHADDAEMEREQELRDAEIEIDRVRLHDIEEAARRLADGRYGVCTDCGEEIARLRLLAQPIAIRCAACQAAWESRRR
jgi:DnaK suppressor protein